MENVQISFDETLLNRIDQVAASSQLWRSAIVRKALQDWLRKKKISTFEQEWITKLKENPEDSKELEPWITVEHWEGE
jgi:metal-responsive CopG/Arc/MetJ family transcriptional regulator